MAKSVLDASALVALVLQERGGNVIARIVEAGAVTSATNMAETLTVCRRSGHRQPSDELLADLRELGIGIEPVTDTDCLEIAYLLRRSDELKAQQPALGSLSLADATCFALGRRLELPVVVSDTTWEILDVGVQVLPFR